MDKLRGGYVLEMGISYEGDGLASALLPLHRYLGICVHSAIWRLFFHIPIGDFHCGLRGFSREAFDRMELRTSGMEFASEMVVKSTLLGLRITEVPVVLSPDGRSRPPHLR